jgi:hypothetical protein
VKITGKTSCLPAEPEENLLSTHRTRGKPGCLPTKPANQPDVPPEPRPGREEKDRTPSVDLFLSNHAQARNSITQTYDAVVGWARLVCHLCEDQAAVGPFSTAARNGKAHVIVSNENSITQWKSPGVYHEKHTLHVSYFFEIPTRGQLLHASCFIHETRGCKHHAVQSNNDRWGCDHAHKTSHAMH